MPELPPDKRQAWASFLLGRVWFERTRDDLARDHLEKAAALWPELGLAHRYLSYVHLRAESFAAGLASSERACELDTCDEGLQWERNQFRMLAGQEEAPALASHATGRLRFRARYDRSHHRSGWQYAMDSLLPLHNDRGVLFESFLEDPFAWQQKHSGLRSGSQLLHFMLEPTQYPSLNAQERRIIPFREPWVGFMHNPPGMPSWLHPDESAEHILASRAWRDSLPHCVGLFTLSEHHARWLRHTTGKPVSALLHPTQEPSEHFCFDAFLHNPRKKIVQVGWWLRRLTAIDRLPIGPGNALNYQKVRLRPHFGAGSGARLAALISQERESQPGEDYRSTTAELSHLDNNGYDALLARNIVFVQLYAASANNTVIECCIRGTPLLVNPLPAVIEYLGADYPLYYRDLEHAAAMALDTGRLQAAHDYLLECPLRQRLGGDYFRQSLLDSEVYQLLDTAA